MRWPESARSVALVATALSLVAIGPAWATGPQHTDAPADHGQEQADASVEVADWSQPRSSVTESPADLAADVTAEESAQVVVVTADGSGLQVDTVRTQGTEEAAQAIAEAQAEPGVVAVGVDHRVHAFGGAADPMRGKQWSLDVIRAEDAGSVSSGSGEVVAVIDSGVDGTHPDLASAIVVGTNTRSSRGDYSSPAIDQNGHGTHVAGIIAAESGNGVGIAGVAPKASIMPVKVLDKDGTGWMADVIDGIVWAADNGADVINMSLGGPDADFSAPAVAYAQSKGVVVVAAAGNEGSGEASYPAALPGVLSVAAVVESESVATYSNWGSTIDIAAPGSHIVSTVPGGYESMSGTSMAAPHVAAVAAMVKSKAPSADVASVLTSTAADAGPSGWDAKYGAGIVDAFAAVSAACPTCGTTAPGHSDPVPSALPSLRGQSVHPPSRLAVGHTKGLASHTSQGVSITSWKTPDKRVCGIRRGASQFRLVGRSPGICHLRVRAPGTDGYTNLHTVGTVRVTRR